jgi:hypothetical protein
MEVKEKLKEIALANGWRFKYARRDYQNLIDATAFISDEMRDAGNGETVLFLDPVVRKSEDLGMRYTGNFMVLKSSNLDEGYEDRAEVNIDPLIQKVMVEMKNKLRCIYSIDNWTSIEVINVFDFNADGLSVAFNLKAE